MGDWYEIYRDAFTPYELTSECVTAKYSLNQDGSVKVINSGFYFNLFRISLEGSANFNGASGCVGFP